MPRGRPRDPHEPSWPAVTALLVAVGGAVGVLARYGLGATVGHGAHPWLTAGINVAGSFLLGLLAALGTSFPSEVRTALAVGVLGGFTTFSTFSLDVVRKLEAGEGVEALVYVLASLLLGAGAAVAGLYIGRTAAA